MTGLAYFIPLGERLRDYDSKWLDREIKENFGLDFLRNEVMESTGFTMLENSRAKGLLFKVEALNERFTDGVQILMGNKISLGVRNISSNKEYSKSYSEVKKQLKLRRSVVEEILSSRFIDAFYADEKATIIKRWSDD